MGWPLGPSQLQIVRKVGKKEARHKKTPTGKNKKLATALSHSRTGKEKLILDLRTRSDKASEWWVGCLVPDRPCLLRTPYHQLLQPRGSKGDTSDWRKFNSLPPLHGFRALHGTATWVTK